MRRLLLLTSSTVLLETIFFSALTPLLPRFTDDLGLAKWEAGVLVAAYALGAFAGALPAGALATRWNVRRTVLLGLFGVAAASVAFGLVDAFWLLALGRLAQGVSGAFCWTGGLAWLVSEAPRERRGELIGLAMAAAVAGALLGPALGGAAVNFGRLPVFAAVSGLCLALAAAFAWLPAPPPGEGQPLRLLLCVLRSRPVIAAMWLIVLPALVFGTLNVLVPLQLDRLGWGAWGVAVTFLVSATCEGTTNPLVGRWSDRSGRLAPIRVALAGLVVLCLAVPWVEDRWLLSVLVVLAGPLFAACFTPAMAMLSDGWEAAGVEHGLGFALMSFAFAPGHFAGSTAGGWLGGAAGDAAAWAVLAALAAASLAALGRRSLRAAATTLGARSLGR